MDAAIARATRNTVGDALRRAAGRFRGRTALRFADRAWSFAELDRGADRVARALLAAGLTRGDRVAAFGRNSDGFLLAWLGCARAGLIHVPANYALTAPELAAILGQCGARALLADPELATVADAAADESLLRGTLSARSGAAAVAAAGDGPLDILAAAGDARWDTGPPPDEALADTDLVQIVYTSGTTGAPKGAMMTHRAYATEYATAAHAFDFTEADLGLAALPLYHTAQLHAFTMPQLLSGAETLLIEAPDPARVLALIEERRITSFFAPPTVWIGLLRHPDCATRNLTSLRRLYYGAAIMPGPVLAELRARLPNALPYHAYGQSEMAPLATVLRPEEHAARPASVGRPAATVETRIVDPEMRDVVPGERGEIVHRSPHLCTGYWGRPEETAEAFRGGWFHSGDIAAMDAEGYITIVDRLRDVINTGGVLVASREVEDAILTHPAVSECAVIGLPDPRWVEAVVAVVVLRHGHAPPDAAALETALIDHARRGLAAFKLPKRVILAEALPRNTAGKVLKRELRALHGGRAEALPGAA